MRHHETQHQELILGALESVLRERHHCMDQKRFLRENLLCDEILGSGTDRYLAARSRGSSSDASTFGAALLLSSELSCSFDSCAAFQIMPPWLFCTSARQRGGTTRQSPMETRLGERSVNAW